MSWIHYKQDDNERWTLFVVCFVWQKDAPICSLCYSYSFCIIELYLFYMCARTFQILLVFFLTLTYSLHLYYSLIFWKPVKIDDFIHEQDQLLTVFKAARLGDSPKISLEDKTERLKLFVFLRANLDMFFKKQKCLSSGIFELNKVFWAK